MHFHMGLDCRGHQCLCLLPHHVIFHSAVQVVFCGVFCVVKTYLFACAVNQRELALIRYLAGILCPRFAEPVDYRG